MRRLAMAADEVKTSFYLPERLLQAAKARAVRDGVTLRTILVRAVAAYVDFPMQEDTDR